MVLLPTNVAKKMTQVKDFVKKMQKNGYKMQKIGINGDFFYISPNATENAPNNSRYIAAGPKPNSI